MAARFGPANSGPVPGADSERRVEREEEETPMCKCLAHLPHGEPIIEVRYSDSAQCYPIVDPVATQLTGSPMVGDQGVVGGAMTLYLQTYVDMYIHIVTLQKDIICFYYYTAETKSF